MSRAVQLSLFPDSRGPTLRDVAETVRLGGVEALTSAQARADHVRYQEVEVRSALAEAHGMPFRWTLNPYRGCTHACAYCYARKYQRHLELGAGDEFSSLIMVKTNLPERLAREVAKPSWMREAIAVGTATDPYQPIEGRYRITRRCLEVLLAARTPFNIVTKGPMVVRDADVIARASREIAPCHVYVSVPSVDDAWEKLEPGTAPPLQRLRAVRQLIDGGIDAGVLMMPLVPGITTTRSSIERTLAAIAETGARFVGANVTHLEEGVRQHFFGFLEREYPELVEGYERLYTGRYAPKEYVDKVKTIVNDARAKYSA